LLTPRIQGLSHTGAASHRPPLKGTGKCLGVAWVLFLHWGINCFPLLNAGSKMLLVPCVPTSHLPRFPCLSVGEPRGSQRRHSPPASWSHRGQRRPGPGPAHEGREDARQSLLLQSRGLRRLLCAPMVFERLRLPGALCGSHWHLEVTAGSSSSVDCRRF
jgi:hypothetical protein